MKTSRLAFRLPWAASGLGLALVIGLGAGCSSHDHGPYLPQASKTPAWESTQPLVLLDPGVQYSITSTGEPLVKTLDDGRMQVVVQLRNRENRRIEVQANCNFKDAAGVVIDESPFIAVILTENSTEQVSFTSLNNNARKFTVRVRQAR